MEIVNCSSPMATGARKKTTKPTFKALFDRYKGKKSKKKLLGDDPQSSLGEEEFSNIEHNSLNPNVFENMDLHDSASLSNPEDPQQEEFSSSLQPQESSSSEITYGFQTEKTKTKTKDAYKENSLIEKRCPVFENSSSSASEKLDEKETRFKSSVQSIESTAEPEGIDYRISREKECNLDWYTESIKNSDKQTKSTQTEDSFLKNKQFISAGYDYRHQYNLSNEYLGYMPNPHQIPNNYGIPPSYQPQRFYFPRYTSPPARYPFDQSVAQGNRIRNTHPNHPFLNPTFNSEDYQNKPIHSLENIETRDAKIYKIVIDSNTISKDKIKKIIFSKSFANPKKYVDIPSEDFKFYILNFVDVPFFYKIIVDFDSDVFKQVRRTVLNDKKKRMFNYNLTNTFFFDTTKNPLDYIKIKVHKLYFDKACDVCLENIKFIGSHAPLPIFHRRILEPLSKSDEFVFSKNFMKGIKNYFPALPTPYHISAKIKMVDSKYIDFYQKIDRAREDCIIILKEIQKMKNLIEFPGNNVMGDIRNVLLFMRTVLKERSFELPDFCIEDSYILYILYLYKVLYEEINSYCENTENFFDDLEEMQDWSHSIPSNLVFVESMGD